MAQFGPLDWLEVNLSFVEPKLSEHHLHMNLSVGFSCVGSTKCFNFKYEYIVLLLYFNILTTGFQCLDSTVYISVRHKSITVPILFLW